MNEAPTDVIHVINLLANVLLQPLHDGFDILVRLIVQFDGPAPILNADLAQAVLGQATTLALPCVLVQAVGHFGVDHFDLVDLVQV